MLVRGSDDQTMEQLEQVVRGKEALGLNQKRKSSWAMARVVGGVGLDPRRSRGQGAAAGESPGVGCTHMGAGSHQAHGRPWEGEGETVIWC